ncbi:hypothetical protein LDO31_18875 [Luteimonas sp. XNQY3]|nr:hypothetical protein [Luteimonas sp. XNQY3]MCD9008255.1 hypothetical protein [Luteimonas sp. XNQY3]
MSEDRGNLKLMQDLLTLTTYWTGAVAIAFAVNSIWVSNLPLPKRTVGVVLLTFVWIGVIAMSTRTFIARRHVAKIAPNDRSKWQRAQVVLLLAGLVVTASLVVDVTMALVTEDLRQQQASHQASRE